MIGHVDHDVGKSFWEIVVGYALPLTRKIHRLREHLRIKIEAHCRHVAALLRAKDAACTTNLKILHSDTHAASQIGILVDRGQAIARFFGKRNVIGEQEVSICLRGRATDTSFELVHLRETQAAARLR